MEIVSYCFRLFCFLKNISTGARHVTQTSLFDKCLLKDDYDPVYLLVPGESQKNGTQFLLHRAHILIGRCISKQIIKEQFGLCFCLRHRLSDQGAGPEQHAANFSGDSGKAPQNPSRLFQNLFEPSPAEGEEGLGKQYVEAKNLLLLSPSELSET